MWVPVGEVHASRIHRTHAPAALAVLGGVYAWLCSRGQNHAPGIGGRGGCAHHEEHKLGPPLREVVPHDLCEPHGHPGLRERHTQTSCENSPSHRQGCMEWITSGKQCQSSATAFLAQEQEAGAGVQRQRGGKGRGDRAWVIMPCHTLQRCSLGAPAALAPAQLPT